MDALVALLAALGGGVLGAILGGRGVAAAAARHLARERAAREARTLINLFQALEAELSQAWERYQHLVGQDLEKAEDMEDLPMAGLAAMGNGFAVFRHSARLLGALDPASARELIAAYIHFQALLEEWQALNLLNDKHRQVRLKADVNLYEARNLRTEVQRFLEYLKQHHLQVKGMVLASLERLRQFLELARQSHTQVTIRL
ncbi:MAG: hypothetical protein WHT07_05850 [Desulfobaccales bacterium]